MALIKLALESRLKLLVMNTDNFPDTFELAAVNFADAVNSYGSLVTPPSTTFSVAQAAFVSAFIGSKSKQNLEIIVDAVVAYCVSLAVGMAAAGFTGVPPPTSTAMKSAILAAGAVAKNGGSASVWASSVAAAIDSYFRTGTAINVATGATVPWS